MYSQFGSPPPGTEPGDGQKNEGFLKSVWHKLMDNSSKPESKDAKDKSNASDNDSKKSS